MVAYVFGSMKYVLQKVKVFVEIFFHASVSVIKPKDFVFCRHKGSLKK